MKKGERASRPRVIARCELCGEPEDTVGDFVTCEGFLVCPKCHSDKGPELAALRRDVEEGAV